jgi:hypothetical protein
MENIVPGAASPQRIRIFCLFALRPLAGTKLNGGPVMCIARNVNSVRGTEVAGRRAGSLLEIDSWIPSETKAIAPLLERLMRLIEGSHCITGEESSVELALREALNNALVHGNRLDAHKLVHVRCPAESAKESPLPRQTKTKGLIRTRSLIPCWLKTSNPSMTAASIS